MNRTWTAIVLAGIGTFAMRASFLALAHRLSEVPPWVERILRQIPAAALAALVVPALVRPQGEFHLFQARLFAGLLAAAVAWRTKNVALTLIIGIASLMIFREF
ncbi:MAG TPA: AzlD domain-containing protein [Sporichthya sp.]|nr:AzlD domain-containing protein [Sporichthya sp.]